MNGYLFHITGGPIWFPIFGRKTPRVLYWRAYCYYRWIYNIITSFQLYVWKQHSLHFICASTCWETFPIKLGMNIYLSWLDNPLAFRLMGVRLLGTFAEMHIIVFGKTNRVMLDNLLIDKWLVWFNSVVYCTLSWDKYLINIPYLISIMDLHKMEQHWWVPD